MKRKLQNLAFCAYAFSLNFEMLSPFGENFSVSKIAAYCYIASLCLDIKKIFNTCQIGLYVICLFLMVIIFMISDLVNGGATFVNISFLLNVFLFWFIANHYREDNTILDKGIISYYFGSILLVLFFILGIGVSINEIGGRLTMFGDNENAVGIKTATAIVFSVYLLLKTKKLWHRCVMMLPLIGLISLNMMTASRTGLAIWSLGVLTLLFFNIRSRVNRVLLIASIGFVFIFSLSNMKEELVLYDRIMEVSEKGDLSGRDDIWKSYLPAIENNPILGVGYDGTQVWGKHYLGEDISPHNVFIEILLYGGVVGLTPFVMFLAMMVIHRFKKYKEEHQIFYVTFLLVIFAYLLSGQMLYVKLFWLLSSLGIAESVIIRRNNEKNIVHNQ